MPDKYADKTIIEADLRKTAGINIIALKQEEGYHQSINRDLVIEKDSILLVSGSPNAVSRFSGDQLPDGEAKKRASGLKMLFG